MKTRFYYPDGIVHIGPDPPAWGVQGIVQPHPGVGAEFVVGGDYYVFWDGRWKAVDFIGLVDFLQSTGLVLFGRTLPPPRFNSIVERAIKDKEVMAVKAGWTAREGKQGAPNWNDVKE